ncbi:MAG: peptidoglycan synthetase FtsI [Actinomycetota bacterium]
MRETVAASRRGSRPSAAHARGPERRETIARRNAPGTVSPMTPFLDRVLHAVWMAFSGDVPESIKGRRITSTESNRRVQRGLRLLMAFVTVAMGVLFLRVAALQTVARGDYLEVSLAQRRRETVVKATRGVIFDRNGNELALSVPRSVLYLDPRDVADPAWTVGTLAELLRWDDAKRSDMLARIARPGAKFVYVAREMDLTDARAIMALGIPGLFTYTEPSRQIEGGVAEALIGQTDPDGLGTSGLELQFDAMLGGRDGTSVRDVDADGRSIAGTSRVSRSPVPGDDIVLTIDKNIQFHVDRVLRERVAGLSAKGGVAIVLETGTGNIIAMSSVRRMPDGSTTAASGNFAMVESHEPGSVAKVLSIGAALNEGAVTPESVFEVPGKRMIDKFLISDAWPHGTEKMDVRRIVRDSSNIGTLMVGEKTGWSTLHRYLEAFGIGRPTGLGYPNESTGRLLPHDKWYGSTKYTITYGYGYSVSPLQLAAAVNTVANKGVYVAPRLVSATIDRSGRRRETDPGETRRVLEESTAFTLTDLLRGVVCHGTGKPAAVRGMDVAGKTGTGYKAQDNGTYVTDQGTRAYFASFAGFFPASDPRVTILVSIDEPDSTSQDRFGGRAAAPVFAQLVPLITHELGIPAPAGGATCPPAPAPLAP